MNEFDRINNAIADFRIQSYDGINLMLIGSSDFSYYHQFELIFHEVSYISLPTDFSYPIFRKASSTEYIQIENIINIDREETVYCIEAETSRSLDKLPFFIVARSVSLKEGMVYYYKRKNLKKGERIAAWVDISD